jgi:hypothetical protein
MTWTALMTWVVKIWRLYNGRLYFYVPVCRKGRKIKFPLLLWAGIERVAFWYLEGFVFDAFAFIFTCLSFMGEILPTR